MSAEWKNVTKSHPCGICLKTDWCSYTVDGVMAMCRRVQSDRPTPSGAWLHVLSETPRELPPLRTLPPAPASLLFSAQIYFDRMSHDPVMLDGLAVELGVSPYALFSLGPRYGLHARGDTAEWSWAWPMRDGGGKMTGIRLRKSDGAKWSVKHGKEGLFYDLGVTVDEVVIVTEGPTDCAAAMTLGYTAVGRPSCMGGVALLKSLFGRWRTRRMVVIADNDEPKTRPDGSVWYPGVEGAQAMVAALGVEYKMLITPTKDIRKWVCAGATRRDVEERLDALRWQRK